MNQIEKIKNLLYSGQKVNIDLAICIMDSFGLTWDSKGFEQEKELVDLCGKDVFCENAVILSYNQLKTLPESIGQLQNLKILCLNNNLITKSEIDRIKALLPKCNVIH